MASAARSPVVVYLGPACSGKTRELVHQYIDALRTTPFAKNLWLAPNARAAAQVREAILAAGMHACLSPGVTTFHDLSQRILADAGVRLRPLRPAIERELLRRVVERALKNNQLQFFAEAAGRSAFVALLADHIHELKRAAISPAAYHRLHSPNAGEEQHRELALLYGEYERLLTAHTLTDDDGSHLAARDALAAGKASAFQNLSLVVVDGFTDFTRTQHDLLRLLASRSERLLITLASDAVRARDELLPGLQPPTSGLSPLRTDLFAKTASTLHELRHHHPGLEVRELAARTLKWPALEHLLRHMFRNPNEVPPAPAAAIESLDQLQIVAAASVQDEIVQIARRIKEKLIATSTRPGDIVVVLRTLAEVAPRVREVFDQFGIPYSLDARLPIATAPVVSALLNSMRLAEENWPFRRVVAIITNNMLTAFDGPGRQSAEWLTRDLQIAEGREKLLSRVEQLAAIETPVNQLSDHMAQRVAAAQTALPLLQLLSQSLGALPEQATPNAWFTALANLATQLGIRDVNDSIAWRALETHCASLEHLDTWLAAPPRELSRRKILNTLVDLVTRESLPPAHDDVGRVRIVAAPAARGTSAKHLYLAGMSEQAFPSPAAAGQLGSDAEYQFLARAVDQDWAAKAAQGPPPATRSQDEMLLFYEVLSRTEESLTISYPALDDKAQKLPPSPYVLEIQRVFGEPMPAQLKPAAPQLSPVSADISGPYSIADWRIQAVARALDDKRDLRPLAALTTSLSTKQLASSIGSALRIIDARARGESFGPAEGLLSSPAVRARLAARFDANHYWSPSQWETYAACPYRFFLDQVLKLTPLGDLVLETDYARRGSRLHNVLATFHREWPSLRGAGPMSADEEQSQFLDQLYRIIEERVAVAADGGIDAALLELDRRQIRKWAEKHFEHHLKYGGANTKRGVQMTPAHLEFRFGPSRVGDDEQDSDSINRAFVLNVDGEKIRITGQIDRIDVGTIDGKKFFSVIDYKSGKKTSLSDEQIASGERLQLPLYVEAAQALLFQGNATPLAAGYWSMTGGFDAKGALAVQIEGDAAERWSNVRGAVQERVAQFVHDIRHGAFPVASRDDTCTHYCDFRTVCRIAQVRSLGKITTTACGLAKPSP